MFKLIILKNITLKVYLNTFYNNERLDHFNNFVYATIIIISKDFIQKLPPGALLVFNCHWFS